MNLTSESIKSIAKPSGRFAPEAPRPVISEGIYYGIAKEWDVQFLYGKYKLLIQIDVFDDDEIIQLTYFANLKMNKHGQLEEPKRTTSLSKLLGSIWPDKDYLECNLDDLVGKRYKLQVATVIKDGNRKPLPERKYYSKVKELFRDDSSDSEVLPF